VAVPTAKNCHTHTHTHTIGNEAIDHKRQLEILNPKSWNLCICTKEDAEFQLHYLET
jgi:hypothetical protein